MEPTDDTTSGGPPGGAVGTRTAQQKFRPVHPAAWLATLAFGFIGLASLLSLIGGLATAQPASIITGAATLAVASPLAAGAARKVRPVVLAETTVSIPTLWTRRAQRLEDISWIALIRSTGRSPAWAVWWWTGDGNAKRSPLRLGAGTGSPDAELRSGRVAGSPAARAATAIYRQALAVQGPSGPLAGSARPFGAQAHLDGASAFWSPDGTSATLASDM